MKNITRALFLCVITCFTWQINAQQLNEVFPVSKETLKSHSYQPYSNTRALEAIYETTHDFTSYVAISPAISTGTSDGIGMAGTNRFIKEITVSLYDIANTLATYNITLTLYTACNTSGLNGSDCNSGPGVLIPGSSQTLTVTPTTQVHQVTFSYAGLDLSGEADNEIAVVLNASTTNIGWLAGNSGRTIGTRTAAETGFGVDTYSRCGSTAVSGNSCNFYFGPVPANPKAIFDLRVVAVPNITPPSLTCPVTTIEPNNAGTCGAVVTFTGIAIDGEDGDISGDIIATPASGSTFPVGDTTVTLSVTDSDGNTATCDFIVTVEDHEAPIAICKNITVDLDPTTSTATIVTADINDGSTDNCNIASYDLIAVQAIQSSLTTSFAGATTQGGNMFDLEPINNLTINSFDINMPTGATQTIEVYFKTGTWVGSATTPGDWTLVATTSATSSGAGTPTPLNLDLGIEVAAGNRVAFYVTSATGSLIYSGGTTVGNLYASDTNLKVYEGAAKSYPFGTTFQPRNFNGKIVYSTVESAPFSGIFDCSNIGVNEVTLQITDDAGNISSCTSNITVQDITAPVINCISGVYDVILDANGTATVDPMDLIVSVEEACSYTITPGSGGTSSNSITTTLTSNNNGAASWTVLYDLTVGANDIEITDIDINTNATTPFNLDLYTIVGSYVGNETNATAWGAPAASGSGTGMGTNIASNALLDSPLTLSANTTYGIAIILDVTVFYTNGTGCPGNQCYDNGEVSLSLGSAVAGIFTGNIFTPRIWNGSINYNITIPSGINFSCADVGENQVEITATDANGNASSCFVTVNVIDNIAPVITCLAGVQIELGADGTATIDPLSLIDTIDEFCGIGTSAVDVPEVNCADIGTTISVTVFVSDVYGNLASCMTDITVVDLLAPVITCPANQIVDPGSGNLFYIIPDYFATGEATAIDNCTAPVTITSQNPIAGTALPDGPHTITFTAEDEYGNESTCSFVLTVDTTLGAESNNLDSGITLSPNPANNMVNLVNKTNTALEKMMIYDINGKLVNQVDLRTMQGQKAVDVSSLAAGIYIIQISGDNASTVKRLIKE